MWTKLLITLAYLAIPILWGVTVNGLFELWRRRDAGGDTGDDRIFPDYQI